MVVRELLQDRGFAGSATGSDQSPVFLQTARELAEAEGCDLDRLSFVLADAHCSDGELAPGSYDAVVMHTLISHTTDPAAVLSEAARLAAPGALLIIMDGDYRSLTFAYSRDPELGRRMDEALVRRAPGSPNQVTPAHAKAWLC